MMILFYSFFQNLTSYCAVDTALNLYIHVVYMIIQMYTIYVCMRLKDVHLDFKNPEDEYTYIII